MIDQLQYDLDVRWLGQILGVVLFAVGSCLTGAVSMEMFNSSLNDELLGPSLMAAIAGFLLLVISSHLTEITKTEPEAAPRPKLTRVK